MDILSEKIAEWVEAIAVAKLEMKTVRAHVGRLGVTRDPFAVALDEAELELEGAEEELASMAGAQLLLQQLATRFDEASRATLTRAVEMLCCVDWATRSEALIT